MIRFLPALLICALVGTTARAEVQRYDLMLGVNGGDKTGHVAAQK